MKSQTKARLLFFAMVLACAAPAWSQDSWQSGRILKVDQSVESKPLYWIANTAVPKDETTYTVAISLGESVLVGVYTLDKFHSAPPEEWVRGRPVKVEPK